MFLISGCRRPQQRPLRDLAKELNDSVSSGLVDGRSFSEMNDIQERALSALRKHGSLHAVEILSQAGYLYSRQGKYEKALEILHEASDSLRRRGVSDFDAEDAIKLYGDLANLYNRFGLNDEALQINSDALRLARGKYAGFRSDLWRFRGEIFNAMGKHDSTIHMLDRSLKDADKDRNPLAIAVGLRAKAALFLEHPFLFRDSLKSARNYLDAVPDSLEKSGKVKIKFFRGYLQVLEKNDVDRGIAMMEDAMRDYQDSGDIEMVYYAEKILMNVYQQNNFTAKLSALYPSFSAHQDSLASRAKQDAIVGAEFKFRLKAMESQIKMLEQDKRLSRLVIIYQWLFIALAVIVIGAILYFGFRYMRKLKTQRQRLRQSIEDLLNLQKDTNMPIENLQEEIRQYKARESEAIGQKIVEESLTALSPVMFSGEKEIEFRKSFRILYPHFSSDLRRDFPSFTPSDELLSMLIYLNQNTDEIALCLGISKASVFSARYRMRKKMNIDKNIDLDDFIRNRRP